MKAIILVSLLVSTAAFANTDSTNFSCEPGNHLNGLEIRQLVLELSDEDPDATMTVYYGTESQPVVSGMSYEAVPNVYDLIPNSSNDGDVSVSLVKNRGKWSAVVTSTCIDTFSVLDCTKK